VRRLRRILAGVMLMVTAFAFAAPPAAAAPDCRPGQHGNNHPGFKPGVCK
jgi:hypothetical protein